MTNTPSLLPSVAYRIAEKQGEAGYQRFVGRRDVKMEVEKFKAGLESITSVDELFRNRRVLEFLAKATGNASEMEYPGRFRKALESDINDPKSLVNRMKNEILKETNKKLKLSETGVETLKSEKVVNDLIDSYLRTQHEKELAAGNKEITNVRYFKQHISEVGTQNVYEILGDRVLREVVTKVLHLPKEIVNQTVEAQGRAITSRLDISRFSDPKFVDKFIEKYLSIADQERQKETGTNYESQIVSLLQSNTSSLFNLLS
ncbi:MAG TPA: DUF1217 domain-containing protein [Azospirillaceae bacterium]|nr:DUF1217 domain-containing protein [Azospirillaceae bacterium]